MDTFNCSEGLFTDRLFQAASQGACDNPVSGYITLVVLYGTFSVIEWCFISRIWFLQHFTRRAYAKERGAQYFCSHRMPVVPSVKTVEVCLNIPFLVLTSLNIANFENGLAFVLATLSWACTDVIILFHFRKSLIKIGRAAHQILGGIKSSEPRTHETTNHKRFEIITADFTDSTRLQSENPNAEVREQSNSGDDRERADSTTLDIPEVIAVDHRKRWLRYESIFIRVLQFLVGTSFITSILLSILSLIFPAAPILYKIFFWIRGISAAGLSLFTFFQKGANIRAIKRITKNQPEFNSKIRFLRVEQLFLTLTVLLVTIVDSLLAYGYLFWWLVIFDRFLIRTISFSIDFFHYLHMSKRVRTMKKKRRQREKKIKEEMAAHQTKVKGILVSKEKATTGSGIAAAPEKMERTPVTQVEPEELILKNES